jgi:hypothetical protein
MEYGMERFGRRGPMKKTHRSFFEHRVGFLNPQDYRDRRSSNLKPSWHGSCFNGDAKPQT